MRGDASGRRGARVVCVCEGGDEVEVVSTAVSVSLDAAAAGCAWVRCESRLDCTARAGVDCCCWCHGPISRPKDVPGGASCCTAAGSDPAMLGLCECCHGWLPEDQRKRVTCSSSSSRGPSMSHPLSPHTCRADAGIMKCSSTVAGSL